MDAGAMLPLLLVSCFTLVYTQTETPARQGTVFNDDNLLLYVLPWEYINDLS